MAGKKLIVIWLGLGLAFLFICLPGFANLARLRDTSRELSSQIEEVRESNRKLEEEKDYLQNDPVYIEKIAREKLGLAREGEIIYKILPPERQ